MRAASFPLAMTVDVPASHWDGMAAVDIFAPEGTAWLAVFDGIARPADYPLGGHALMLTAADGTTAYYAHGLPDRASGPVRAGQVIGAVSDTGNAKGTGHHLHFAVGEIDANGAGTIAPDVWLSGAAVATDRQGAAGAGPAQEQDRSRLILMAAAALLLMALVGE